MKPYLASVLALLLLLSLSSCYKVKCLNPGVYLYFQNYDSASLVVVKLKEYERGSQFSTLVSEKTGSIFKKPQSGDTLSLGEITAALNLDHDFTVEVPATGQTFKIRDFSIEQEKQEIPITGEVRDNCSNTVHYYLNDTAKAVRGPAEPSDYPGSADIVLYR